MSFLQDAGQFLGPYYFGTLVAAAFGTFAGAWATSRRETKRAVVAELTSLSAARALSFSICNRFLALKKQHVQSMYVKYSAARSRVMEDVRHGDRDPKFPADLQSLTPVWLPIEALERQLFEKTSARGRAMAAAIDLIGAIDGLNQAIRNWSELVLEFRQASPLTRRQLAEKYFGLATADGVVDDRFRANVFSLSNQTDDCIFFSKILADDLYTYTRRLRRRNAWKFRLSVPKEQPPDWTFAEAEGLLPNEMDCANWLRGFRKLPNRLQRIRMRFFSGNK